MAKDDADMGLLLLAGKPQGGKGPSGESSDDGETLAAKGILRAIERGDAAALSRALKEHYEYCRGGESVSGDLDGDDSDDY